MESKIKKKKKTLSPFLSHFNYLLIHFENVSSEFFNHDYSFFFLPPKSEQKFPSELCAGLLVQSKPDLISHHPFVNSP